MAEQAAGGGDVDYPVMPKKPIKRRSSVGEPRLSFKQGISLTDSIIINRNHHEKNYNFDVIDEIENEQRVLTEISSANGTEAHWKNLLMKQNLDVDSEESDNEDIGQAAIEMDTQLDNIKQIGTKCKTIEPFDYGKYIKIMNEKQTNLNKDKRYISSMNHKFEMAKNKLTKIVGNIHSENLKGKQDVRNMLL